LPVLDLIRPSGEWGPHDGFQHVHDQRSEPVIVVFARYDLDFNDPILLPIVHCRLRGSAAILEGHKARELIVFNAPRDVPFNKGVSEDH